MNAREIAYLSLLASLKEEGFISQKLEELQTRAGLSPLDFAFAYEIAAGSARMGLALDFIAENLSAKQKLSLKLKERALLRTAIYQHCFMDKVPLYAIVNETMGLAKKYCHPMFSKFLNALLRKLESGTPPLPSSDSPRDLSIRLSYPQEYISMLTADYGTEKTKELLSLGNTPPNTLVRIRPGCSNEILQSYQIAPLSGAKAPLGTINEPKHLRAIASSPHLYIQNATPADLIYQLAERSSLQQSKSLNLLDLCSSPGGKLIALHDLYPNAHLFANDISEDKLVRIRQNIAKYSIAADLQCHQGEDYPERSPPFDLVVIDAPCSNSGVLNKRPEARWRINNPSLEQLHNIQKKLLERALKLIGTNGEIWFMTCSILKNENESLIKEFSKAHPVDIIWSHTQLPNTQGWDGGFACLLRKRAHP